jgi:hypothetical protein
MSTGKIVSADACAFRSRQKKSRQLTVQFSICSSSNFCRRLFVESDHQVPQRLTGENVWGRPVGQLVFAAGINSLHTRIRPFGYAVRQGS